MTLATMSHYPGGFANGVTVRGVPVPQINTGKSYYVHYTSGSDGNNGTLERPFKTLDYAIGRCTANNGDVIYLKAGHSESITAAAGIVCDVAGVTIVGLGYGENMAQILFTTAATVDIDITAASVRFINVRFTAGVADITGGFDVAAAADSTEFWSCRFDESTTDLNWVIVIDVVSGADNFKMIDCDYIGNDASNDTLIAFAGTHTGTQIIGNRFYHLTAQTAAAAFITSATAQLAMVLEGNFMHTETAAITASGFVVLTGTTNNGLAKDNVLSSVDADLTAAQFLASFDVTGLCSIRNAVSSGVADTYALTDSFLTIEDLT